MYNLIVKQMKLDSKNGQKTIINKFISAQTTRKHCTGDFTN